MCSVLVATENPKKTVGILSKTNREHYPFALVYVRIACIYVDATSNLKVWRVNTYETSIWMRFTAQSTHNDLEQLHHLPQIQ